MLETMSKRTVPAEMGREGGVGPNGAPVFTLGPGDNSSRRKSLCGDDRDRVPAPQIISFQGAE